MPWPTPQDYNEAIQNVQLCFQDEELQSGAVELNKLGLPRSITGSFASVYSVKCGTTHYAVRCLLNDIPDQKLRYQRLSKAICSDSLDYTVDFEYQQDGIKVGNTYFPIVKMAWIPGVTLDVYVEKHHANQKKMKHLQEQFREMALGLMAAGFAHGDLQHGNILISENGLRLVDYDGMFVPSLSGLFSNELGHRNYQHPKRAKEHFGPYLDNFSIWVIDTTLSCIIEDPTIYSRLHSGNETLLFQSDDFKNPIQSDLFFELEKHESDSIRRASKLLRTVASCLPYNVPALSSELPEAPELPRIIVMRESAKRLAEWAESEKIAQKEREQSQKDKEEAQKKAQALQMAEKAKPGWLDDKTAQLLEARKPQAKPKDSGNSKSSSPAGPPLTSNAAAPVAPIVIATKQDYLKAMEAMRNPWAVRTGTFANQLIDFSAEFDECGGANDYGITHSVFHLLPAQTSAKYNRFAIPSKRRELALKLFCHLIFKFEHKYTSIRKAISDLPERPRQYLLTPELIEGAIKVGDTWLSAVALEWQTGRLRLDDFLRLKKPDFDYTLLSKFRKMMTTLQGSGVAHGSLEPSNILVSADNQLVLVDYDNFYTGPSAGIKYEELDQVSIEYRHPLFSENDFGPNMDHFQAWLIDTLIMIWSADRNLWRSYVDEHKGYLFFHPNDFSNPVNSVLLNDLANHPKYEFADRGQFLLKCLQHKPSEIPSLTYDGSPAEF